MGVLGRMVGKVDLGAMLPWSSCDAALEKG